MLLKNTHAFNHMLETNGFRCDPGRVAGVGAGVVVSAGVGAGVVAGAGVGVRLPVSVSCCSQA